MALYSVVKKGKYYKTVFSHLVSSFVEQGAEEVKENVIFATRSTNYVNPNAPAYVSMPNGIHPSVMKIEYFQTVYSLPEGYKHPALEEGYVLLGPAEAFPEEETAPVPATAPTVEPVAVEQAAAPAPAPAPTTTSTVTAPTPTPPKK